MKASPRDQELSHKRITRRGLIIGGAQLGLIGLLGWRMQQLQLEQSDQFRLLAEENRINVRLLPPARGMVFDREGRIIAENEQNYRIVMVREDAGDVDAVLAELAQLVEIPTEAMEKAREDIFKRSPFVPVTVADRMSWEDVARVSANAPALPGIHAEFGLSRYYPRGADFAHVLGYVGPVSDYDLSRIDDQDPLLQIPKFQIGKTGVENKLERQLRGRAGSRKIEVNAVGRVMRELEREEGIAGDEVQLTIDSRLQNYVQTRLGNESASAVVIDCTNGDLLALGSAPSFDPNLFVRGISVSDYQALTENKYRPLANKAVQGTYPPGSTFKMITALAALEDNRVGSRETVYCGGYTEVSGTRFHCWKRGGHGNVDLKKSLRESCDLYYYDIAQRVGIDKMAQMARTFGLGVRHDLPLSAVAEGLAPDKDWKRSVRDEDWRIGDTVNASIGQGYVLASPLQLAVMSARIATGKSVTPRIIARRNGEEMPSGAGEDLGISPTNLQSIREAMYEVSNDRKGTAYGSRVIAEDFRIAGKTGTTQVKRITAEERASGIVKNEDRIWEHRDHALFVSFAPYENPRYAVAVVVEHGGSGSRAAAPLARDILLQALYEGTPPLDAYPAKDRDRITIQQEELDLWDGVEEPRPTRDQA
ncbi:MAG: penicillin-binding protein 2 [Pseudomonadota bacterium]